MGLHPPTMYMYLVFENLKTVNNRYNLYNLEARQDFSQKTNQDFLRHMKKHKVGQDLLRNKTNQEQLWAFKSGLPEGVFFWVASAVIASYIFSQMYFILSR